MNALGAVAAGIAIGLSSMGGLWLTVRYAVRSPRCRAVLAISHVLRMSIAAAGFYAVSREGPGFLLPALAGFLISRQLLIFGSGAVKHAAP